MAAQLLPVETKAAEHLATDMPPLSKALADAKPGDIVFVSQGEPGRLIELRAQTPGSVILCGRSRLNIGGVHLVVSGLRFADGCVEGHVISFRSRGKKPASHCRVTQCAVTDYNPPEKKMDSRWVSMFGRHNRVDHRYFATKTTLGTTLGVWLYDDLNCHRIDHNYFGPRPYLHMNGAETIRIGTSGRAKKLSRTLVEWNLFEGCGGEAEIISDRSTENLRWLANLVHGAEFGIPRPTGISLIDPKLRFSGDGRWRPAEDNPVAGAAEGQFAFATHDIDGQPRSQPRDVGCDQQSTAPVTRQPLTRDMVGPARTRSAVVLGCSGGNRP